MPSEDRRDFHVQHINIGAILGGFAGGDALRWCKHEADKLENEGHKSEAADLIDIWCAGTTALEIAKKGVRTFKSGELDSKLKQLDEAGAVFPRKMKEEVYHMRTATLLADVIAAKGESAFLAFCLHTSPWVGEADIPTSVNPLAPRLTSLIETPIEDRMAFFMQAHHNLTITDALSSLGTAPPSVAVRNSQETILGWTIGRRYLCELCRIFISIGLFILLIFFGSSFL